MEPMTERVGSYQWPMKLNEQCVRNAICQRECTLGDAVSSRSIVQVLNRGVWETSSLNRKIDLNHQKESEFPSCDPPK